MKKTRLMSLSVLALSASLAIVGCTKKEEEAAPVVEAPPAPPAPPEAAAPATGAATGATSAPAPVTN